SDILGIEEQALITEYNKIIVSKSKKGFNVSRSGAESKSEVGISAPDIPQKNTLQITRDLQEKEIIRLLLHYGHMPAYWEKDGNLPIAVFMFIALKDVELRHPACKKIAALYQKILESQNLPRQQDFILHNDKDVSELAISLLSEKHML